MWDPRFAELAAARLRESRALAARDAQVHPAPGTFRLVLGAVLMRLGQRLAGPVGRTPVGTSVGTPVGRPATLAR